MPARKPSDEPGKSPERKDSKAKAPELPAGGAYGDRQPQYGTGAPRWQEPVPGSEAREDFGAGGEAVGSSSGQGRYGPIDDRTDVQAVPDEPAWEPFAQPKDAPRDSSAPGAGSKDHPAAAQSAEEPRKPTPGNKG